MVPAPMKDTISYGPSRVPAVSAMGTCGVYQVAVQRLAEARGPALLGGQVEQRDVLVPCLAGRATVDLQADAAARFDLRVLFDVLDRLHAVDPELNPPPL